MSTAVDVATATKCILILAATLPQCEHNAQIKGNYVLPKIA